MNRWVAAPAVILVGLLAAPAASRARPNRPNLIPNGTKFSGANCHVTPGGPRNPFGHEIEEQFLTPWPGALTGWG